MNPEDRKAYNAKYYAEHKDRIIKAACEKVYCDKCGRSVIKNNIKSHQKSKICERYANEKKLKSEEVIEEPPVQPDVDKIEINEQNFNMFLSKLEDFIDRTKQTKQSSSLGRFVHSSEQTSSTTNDIDIIPKDTVKNKIKQFDIPKNNI